MGFWSTSKVSQINKNLKIFIFRLKESKVLIVGFYNSCTELARHLTLSGVNVHFLVPIYSNQENHILVTEKDPYDEFLFSKEDFG